VKLRRTEKREEKRRRRGDEERRRGEEEKRSRGKEEKRISHLTNPRAQERSKKTHHLHWVTHRDGLGAAH